MTFLDYGQNRSFTCGDFSDTPLSVVVLLASTAVPDGCRPSSLDDLKDFGMRLSSCPGPTYFKLLYVDSGREGLLNAFSLLYGYLACVVTKNKRLAQLKVIVTNASSHTLQASDVQAEDSSPTVEFASPAQGQQGQTHAAQLRAPDVWGGARLVLQHFASTDGSTLLATW